MKSNCKLAALALALVMMIGLLTGCSASAEEKPASTDLVVVALQGANMPAASAALLEPYLSEAVSADAGSSFTLILADGSPFQAGYVKWDCKESLNEAHWKEEKEQRISQCVEILNQTARTPETDLLGALNLASRALSDGSADQKKLVIVHNGIPTATGGCLSFIGADLGLLNESIVQTLAAQLQEEQALPDLTGVDVDWIYLGEGVEPQQSVSSQSYANLQLLWQTVLEDAGAETVTFKSTLPDTGAVEGAPAVTAVACSRQQVTLPDLSEPVALNPAAVGFEADSTTLSDPAAAAEYLAPYAEAIQQDADSRYVVAGSTADTAGSTAESSTRFGLERARSVCEVLTRDLEVSEDLLVPLGVGNLPTSVRSADDQANRTVWLVAADTDLGRELLDVGLAA